MNTYRHNIGFLGCPDLPDFAWTRERLQQLVDLGFDCIQLNIAWGSRPADDALNLEDVVDLHADDPQQRLELRCQPGAEARQRRQERLRQRIGLCQELGLRCLFHFGAPYNQHLRQGDAPPNCISDPACLDFYRLLLDRFDEQFPGVDDILLYTYDQDAWCCSEFDDCPRCQGRPLHERVSHFVNGLARHRRKRSSTARLLWEPWELSAGQVQAAIPLLDAEVVVLCLHSNVAEVTACHAVDHWLRRCRDIARENRIPIIIEHFLGGCSEEVEPFTRLSWPGEIWRALRDIHELGIAGIKEYYGLIPDREDANLRMSGLLLAEPDLDLDTALQRLAAPYGAAADEMIAFWRACSQAMASFPWDISWWIREVGKCNPSHAMSAAFMRGKQAHTPSWESSRRAHFMSTDNREPDPWALEDLQLRCQQCCVAIDEIMARGQAIADELDGELASALREQCEEWSEFQRRSRSYALHARESNCCHILRRQAQNGQTQSTALLAELRALLQEDIGNQGQQEPCASALSLLKQDPEQFLQEYYLPGGEDGFSKGAFSLTSR